MAAANARPAHCGRRAGGNMWGRSSPDMRHTFGMSSPALCAIAHWGGRSSIPETVFKPIRRGVLDTRIRGYDGCGELPEVLRRQLDRRTMWRAVGGVVP